MQCAGLALALIMVLCVPALAAERAAAEHVVTEHGAAEHPGTEHVGSGATEHGAAERARAPERVCLTAAQAREMIALHKLAEPFRVMQTVAHRFQGEALRVKLCRRKDEFIYEISLLRRDGRVIHAFVNAPNGKIIKAVNAK